MSSVRACWRSAPSPRGPRPLPPRSTTSWFLLTCGKVLVAAGVGLAILIWLAYLGKLPVGL